MSELMSVLPTYLEKIIGEKDDLEEIRFRINQPIEIVSNNSSHFLPQIFTEADAKEFLGKISQHSVYRLEEELRNGYITIRGGHRIGIAGKVTLQQGQVKAITHISSFNIRIAKEHKGIAQSIAPHLVDHKSKVVLNTMVIGPPKSGKTTLLRDLIRSISDGLYGIQSQRVSLVDERSEIAAPYHGIPQHDIGQRTDVMADCPKTEGMMMMIRSMSPEIIVVDEIGHHSDVKSLQEAIHAGVQVICSVHGQTISQIQSRPSLQPLFSNQVFQRYVLLEEKPEPGKVSGIFDKDFNLIQKDMRRNQNEMDRSRADTVHVYVGRNRYR